MVVRSGVVAAALIVGLAGILAACGIEFGEASTETEIFKDIAIEGSFVSGEPLTVTLSYARQYPVEVRVRCDLLTKAEVPTATPLPTATVSPLEPTPEPTLPRIPRVHPTPRAMVLEIFGDTLDPFEDGGPVSEATPALSTLERRFRAPEPGEYVVWCYTPDDRNNAIFEDLTIRE